VKSLKGLKKGEKTYEILKNIDIVSPDVKTALEKPDKAIFISAKRTLRERGENRSLTSS
jgi:hypothetical protein